MRITEFPLRFIFAWHGSDFSPILHLEAEHKEEILRGSRFADDYEIDEPASDGVHVFEGTYGIELDGDEDSWLSRIEWFRGTSRPATHFDLSRLVSDACQMPTATAAEFQRVAAPVTDDAGRYIDWEKW